MGITSRWFWICRLEDIERRHRTGKALELQFRQSLKFHQLIQFAERFAVYQNLPALRFAAQAGSEIRDVPDRVIIDTSLEADVSNRRVARRQADSESEVIALAEPTL